MKTNVERIRYYTKKVNEYSTLRFDRLRDRTKKNVSCYRFPRLMRYKSVLAERLRREGDESNRV